MISLLRRKYLLLKGNRLLSETDSSVLVCGNCRGHEDWDCV